MEDDRGLGDRDPFHEKRARMVRALKDLGYIRSSEVERALLRVPREEFVPDEYRSLAYEDRPLPIGYGQTISAPSVVARMVELLRPKEGDRVLDVGTGSGYQAAVIAEIVAPEPGSGGHVWTIERIPELADQARRNLCKAGYLDRVTVVVGDGSKGYPEAAPYDGIIVGAASPRIPEPLIEQLAVGGRLVIPLGQPYSQRLVVVVRVGPNELREERDIEVIFVPLIGEYGYKEDEYYSSYGIV